MAGESQKEPTSGVPDPSVLTTEQMLREVANTEEKFEAKFQAILTRLDGIDRATTLLHDDMTRFPTEVQQEIGHLKELTDIRLKAERDIGMLRETNRLELKADSEKALSTAREADQKAVAAALAAAEKARDQQTIASQLVTDKSELRLIDALTQQQQTFTVAIASVVEGVNETKTGVAELRNLKAGGQANTSSIYAAVGFASTVLVIITVLVANGVFSR